MAGQSIHLFTEIAPMLLPLGGFIIGLSFGAIVITTNFCTMGAVADMVTFQDYRRFRSWVLAAAVALAGAQLLSVTGIVDLRDSIYLRGHFNWFGAVIGGAVFGFGMVLAGGCPGRNLVRAGSGDLRALLVLVAMGLFTTVLISGWLAPLRQIVIANTAIAPPVGVTLALPDLLAYAIGMQQVPMIRIALVVAVAIAAFAYCLADAPFRASRRHLLGGIAIGACAIAGWAVTGLARDDFMLMPWPPASITFIRPVANSLDYVISFPRLDALSFGVGLVLGSLIGASSAALVTGRFSFRGFAGLSGTARDLSGAAMMGLGGVLALGCSIGQGVSGISTMGAGSFLAFAAMVLGAVLGVKYLERWA